MALLSVDRLTITYRSADQPVRAVDAVTFAVDPGEILAVVGESGSGKSSVALALTGLLPLGTRVSGAVRFGGQDLLTLRGEALRRIRGRRIGYVFQDPATSLNPVLTIGAQMAEALRLHTAARGAEVAHRAVEWLERVGMTDATRRLAAYPHEFSGGMRQRVCLAMALAASPELLVADEPTTALDVTVQVQILRLMRDLQRRLGLAILLISHDLTVVERLAHRVGVMTGGRLVELGETAQILRAPRHDYTRQLIATRDALALPGERRDGG